MRVWGAKLRAGEGLFTTIVVKPSLAPLETRDYRVTRIVLAGASIANAVLFITPEVGRRLDDRALAIVVAEFKGKFFREKDKEGNPIDYTAAVSGALQLVPDAETLKALEADY
jgi:hypothetical protein